MTFKRHIANLYRYPMKGFSEEPLHSVDVMPGAGFPMDRSLAVTDGTWAYEKASYVPKNKLQFIGLMQHPSVALLRLRADAAARMLQVEGPDGPRFELDADADPARADAFIDHLVQYLGLPSEPRPSLVKGEGGTFSDFAMLNRAGVHKGNTQFAISVINLASLRDLESRMGVPLDPLRFRANVYYDGDMPWEEQGWFGKHLKIGSATVKAVMSTPRCAIPSVNPKTGARDANVLAALLKHYKHKDLGFYVDVVVPGAMAVGDELAIVDGVEERHNLVSVPLNGVSYSVFVRETS